MIERFIAYLARKGYVNHTVRNFHEDMHGVSCHIKCDGRAQPNQLRKDFTQAFEVDPGWYNVRLGKADFDNHAITEGLW